MKVGESAWDNNKITDTLKALRPMVRCCLPQSPAPILRKQRDAGRRVDRRIEYGRCSLGSSYRSDTQQGPTPRKVTDVLQRVSKSGFVKLTMHGGWRKCRSELGAGVDQSAKRCRYGAGRGFDFNQSKFNRATQALRQVVPTSNRSSTPRRWIKV